MFDSIMLSAQSAGLFSHVNKSHDNNQSAKSLVDTLGCGALLCQLTAMPFIGQRLLGYFELDSQQGKCNCFTHIIIHGYYKKTIIFFIRFQVYNVK